MMGEQRQQQAHTALVITRAKLSMLLSPFPSPFSVAFGVKHFFHARLTQSQGPTGISCETPMSNFNSPAPSTIGLI